MNFSHNPIISNCFSKLTSGDTPLVLATVIQAVSPTSAVLGDKALVSAEDILEGWVGGGCVRHAVIKAADKALRLEQPCVIRVGPKGQWEPINEVTDFNSSCLSEGTLMIFIDPLSRQPSLSILGNSPAAHSLSYQAIHIGFSVTMLSTNNTDSKKLINNVSYTDDFSNISSDFVVIATQGQNDRSAIVTALSSNASYIAMIASSKKIIGLKAILEKSGIDPKQLERIHSPAGSDIGAITPEEIALSVLSEIIRTHRSGDYKDNQATIEKLPKKEAKETNSGGCCDN